MDNETAKLIKEHASHNIGELIRSLCFVENFSGKDITVLVRIFKNELNEFVAIGSDFEEKATGVSSVRKPM